MVKSIWRKTMEASTDLLKGVWKDYADGVGKYAVLILDDEPISLVDIATIDINISEGKDKLKYFVTIKVTVLINLLKSRLPSFKKEDLFSKNVMLHLFTGLDVLFATLSCTRRDITFEEKEGEEPKFILTINSFNWGE